MVDATQAHGPRYITMNPGSSFRGLHDSLVNYGGNSLAMAADIVLNEGRPALVDVACEKV